MRNAVTSSALTTAPEVSPPATTRRPTPGATRPFARVAMVFSIAWLDFSTPYLACRALTASGDRLAESRIGASPSWSLAQASAASPTGFATANGVGVEAQVRSLEGGDLAQGGGRAGAGQHRAGAGDLRQGIGIGLVRQQTAAAVGGRQAERHAGSAGDQPVVADRLADDAEIGVGHGVDDDVADPVGRQPVERGAQTRSIRPGPASAATSPTLCDVWRASTRTRLASVIGFSG